MSSSKNNNNEDRSNDNSKSTSSSSSSGRKGGANGSNSRFTPISGGSISKRLTAMKMAATTSNSKQRIQCASGSQQAMMGEDPDDYASVSSVDHDRLRREMVSSSPAFGSQKTITSNLQQEPHTFSTLLSTASSTNKSYAAAPSSIIQSSSSTASFENFEQSSTIPSGLKEDCQSKISLSKLFEKSDIDGLASSYIPSSSADQPASVTSPKTPITNKLLIPKRQQQSAKKSSWPDLKNKIYQQRKSAMSDTRSETMSFQTAMKNPSQPPPARRSFVKLSKETLQPPGAASRIIKATNSKERESRANLASSSNESLHKNDLPTEKVDEVVSAPKQQVSQGSSGRDGLPRVGSLKDLSNNGLPNINGLLAKDVQTSKVGSSKEGTPKVGLSKIGTPKVGPSKEGLSKVRSSKPDSTKEEELSNEKLPVKVVSSKTDSTPKDVGLPRVLSSKDSSSPKDGFIKRKVSKVLSKEGPTKRSSFFSKEKVLTKESGSDLPMVDDFLPKNASSSKDSSLSKDFCLPKDVASKESCPKIQGSKDQLQSKEKLPGSKELLPREQLSIEFYPPSKLSKSGDPVAVAKNSPAKGESVLVKMSSPPKTPKTSKTSTSACANDQKPDDGSRSSKSQQIDEKVEQSSKSKKAIVIQERSNSNSKKDDDKVEQSTKSKKSSSNSSKAADDDQEKSSKSRKSSSNSRKRTDDREQSSKSRKSSSNSRKRTDDRERSSRSRRSSRSSRSKRRSDKTERSSKSKKKTTDNGNNEQSNSDSKKNSDDKSEAPSAIREYRSTRKSGPSRGGKSEYYDPSENNPKMGPLKESKSSRSAKKSGARKVPPTISSSNTRLRLKELQFYEIFRLIMVIVTVIQGACLLFAVVLVIWLHDRFLPLLETQHSSEQTGYIILITLLVIQFLVLIWSWALLVWERTITLFLSTLLTAGMQITMIVYFSSGDIFRLLSLSLLIYAFLLIALAVEDWRLKETRSNMHHK